MSRRNQATVDQEVSFGIDEELVSTTDLRGVITYANDNFCKVSGYTINELTGKTITWFDILICRQRHLVICGSI